MQFTFGVGGTPYHEFDAYGNVISGFRVPAVSLFYIIAMALLCLHLRHGLWSMFQTLGFITRATLRHPALAIATGTLRFLRLHLDPHRSDAPRNSAGPLMSSLKTSPVNPS